MTRACARPQVSHSWCSSDVPVEVGALPDELEDEQPAASSPMAAAAPRAAIPFSSERRESEESLSTALVSAAGGSFRQRTARPAAMGACPGA